MLRTLALPLCLLATLAAGCRSHVHRVHGPTAVVSPGHLHAAGCGHVRHGKRWVVVRRGHVHRVGCGHALRGGIWIVID